MKTEIRDVEYEIVDINCHTNTNNKGLCDYKNRKLYIPMNGNSKDDLDTIIHELLHASLPEFGEWGVERITNEIVEVLWNLGWRKVDE